MLSFDLSASWRDVPLAVVDTETTGLDAAEGKVIEIAIVRYEKGQIAERWSALLDPKMPIPSKAMEISGITDEMVAGKPSFRDLKWEIWGRLRDRLFVAWNADFDSAFLAAEFRRCGLSMPDVPVLDPLVWAKQLMPSERNHRLESISEKLGFHNPQAHRALYDAETAGKVMFRLAEKVSPELGALLKEQAGWKAAQDEAYRARKAARAETKGPTVAPEPVPERKQAGLFG